ncbi:MAG: isoaspartyl peptidase/L-asparaginase [Henriciella sp.]|uniref:isoaspartyl peptidase/L-asparaginase family protein n=1 Tax=Henriciella sp. TaxID=1968823 RepID=UPI003C744D85
MSKTSRFALAIHGGAGVKPDRDYSEVEAHLTKLIAHGETMMSEGASAVATVETMVIELEQSGLYVAGRGAAPSKSGRYELDAAIMDGDGPRAGAVASVSRTRSPIRAARTVMDTSPYIMFVGEGADAFCAAQGLPEVEDAESWYRLPVGVSAKETQMNELSHGTVGAVALDSQGRLAAATSTGGLFGKEAGRVGDTPLIGVGTFASRTVAVSCTGLGEYFMLAGVARDIEARMTYSGRPLADAAQASLDAVARLGGDGGLIAIAASGEIVMPFNSPGMKRACVREGESPKVSVL